MKTPKTKNKTPSARPKRKHTPKHHATHHQATKHSHKAHKIARKESTHAKTPTNISPSQTKTTSDTFALHDAASGNTAFSSQAGRAIRPVLSWHAPEYVQRTKGWLWYGLAGLITIASIVGAFMSDNWSMGLAIATFAVVYLYLQHYHPPKQITISLTLEGIHVGEMFFPYSHIQAFWIFDHHGVKTLNLRIRKRWWSDVAIQLSDQDPVAARQYLVTQITEWEGKHEKLGDIILRLLKL